MKFQIGYGAAGGANRLSVHPAHETEKGLGRREEAQDIFTLVIESGTADFDQAGVIRPQVEAELPEPGGVEPLRRDRLKAGGLVPFPLLDSWMFGQMGHRALQLYVYTYTRHENTHPWAAARVTSANSLPI